MLCFTHGQVYVGGERIAFSKDSADNHELCDTDFEQFASMDTVWYIGDTILSPDVTTIVSEAGTVKINYSAEDNPPTQTTYNDDATQEADADEQPVDLTGVPPENWTVDSMDKFIGAHLQSAELGETECAFTKDVVACIQDDEEGFAAKDDFAFQLLTQMIITFNETRGSLHKHRVDLKLCEKQRDDFEMEKNKAILARDKALGDVRKLEDDVLNKEAIIKKSLEDTAIKDVEIKRLKEALSSITKNAPNKDAATERVRTHDSALHDDSKNLSAKSETMRFVKEYRDMSFEKIAAHCFNVQYATLQRSSSSLLKPEDAMKRDISELMSSDDDDFGDVTPVKRSGYKKKTRDYEKILAENPDFSWQKAFDDIVEEGGDEYEYELERMKKELGECLSGRNFGRVMKELEARKKELNREQNELSSEMSQCQDDMNRRRAAFFVLPEKAKAFNDVGDQFFVDFRARLSDAYSAQVLIMGAATGLKKLEEEYSKMYFINSLADANTKMIPVDKLGCFDQLITMVELLGRLMEAVKEKSSLNARLARNKPMLVEAEQVLTTVEQALTEIKTAKKIENEKTKKRKDAAYEAKFTASTKKKKS